MSKLLAIDHRRERNWIFEGALAVIFSATITRRALENWNKLQTSQSVDDNNKVLHLDQLMIEYLWNGELAWSLSEKN